MKMLKKTVPLWALLLVVIVSTSAVAATLIIQRNVNLSLTITPVMGMEVLGSDGATPLTSVPLGEFYRGDSKTFPSTYPTDKYYIKNTGDANVYIKYDVGTMTSGCTMKVYVDTGSGFVELTKNGIYATPIPADTAWKMYFTFDVGESAPFGTFNPKLEFYAYDSASG